jgi:hypothetical protein
VQVIEPMLSSQWFVKMDGMANKGIQAVRSGDVQIIPERFEKVYFNWLENIQVSTPPLSPSNPLTLSPSHLAPADSGGTAAVHTGRLRRAAL